MARKKTNSTTNKVNNQVDLGKITTKELRGELVKRGKAKAKTGAGKAKKWVFGALALIGAAGTGAAVGYSLKRDNEDPVVMIPDDDGTTRSCTIGELDLPEEPTEEN